MNKDELETVWIHTINTNASASVAMALMSATKGSGFNWSNKPYGMAADSETTFVSELIGCMARNLREIGSSEWADIREAWMGIWEEVSKDKNTWDDYTWKSCINAVRQKEFSSGESDVQMQILQEVPLTSWQILPKEQLHEILKDALVKGDAGLVSTLIEVGADVKKGHLIKSREHYAKRGYAYVLTPSICVTKNIRCIEVLMEAGAGIDDLEISYIGTDGKEVNEFVQSSWDFFMDYQNKDNNTMLNSERVEAASLILKRQLRDATDKDEYKKEIICRLIEGSKDRESNRTLLGRLIKMDDFKDCFKLGAKMKYDISILNFMALTDYSLCDWFLKISNIDIEHAREVDDAHGFKLEHYAMMGRSGSISALDPVRKSVRELALQLEDDKFLMKLLNRTIELSELGVFDNLIETSVSRHDNQPLSVMHALLDEVGKNQINPKFSLAMKKTCSSFSFNDQLRVIKMLGRLSRNGTSLIKNRGADWLSNQVICKNVDNSNANNEYTDVTDLRICMALMDSLRLGNHLSDRKEDVSNLLALMDTILSNPKIWNAIVELESGGYADVWKRDFFDPMRESDGGVVWNRMKNAGEAAILKQINGVSGFKKLAVAL